MTLQAVNGIPQPGGFRVFTTNGGAHSPELMAEISLHQLVTDDSNPLKRFEIRQSLTDLYRQLQCTARLMFGTAHGEDLLMRAVIQILAKDINTALDIERQLHRE